MEPLLQGKRALISGGARRVGRAIALACARSGADIIVHYRHSEDDAVQVVSQITALGRRAIAVRADLGIPQQARLLIDRATAHLGGIDLLINNAAVFRRCSLCDPDDERFETSWRESFETNLLAPARLARYASAQLVQNQGTIINIIDVVASVAWPGYAHYVAMKAGLLSLTQTLAVELAPHVRVVGVSPGLALFPEGLSSARRDHYTSQTLLGRAGSVEDIADTVVFVAGQDYITGAIISVDGGLGVRRLD